MKAIKKFASLLLFAGVLASCQKEIVVETLTTDSPTTFSAALEEQPQSRVTIDGFAPKFEVGDVLNVTASNNAKASFKVTEVSSAGVATLNIDGVWSAEPVAPYYIYNGEPALLIAQVGMMSFNAPNNVMDAKANSLDNMTFVAKANSLENVTMLNASCLIKIVVPESVRDIKVAPCSGEITTVAGINLTSGININQTNKGQVDVTYSGHNGLGLTAGTYYIPLFPQTFNDGVRVGYSTDGQNYVWREKEGSFTFDRNKIYDMGSLADWVVATPSFSLEDVIGEYSGSVTMGMSMSMTGGVTGNPTNYTFVVAESDDSSKGNVMFTSFAGANGKMYAQFDLVSGTVTLPVGTVFATSSFGNVTFTNPLVLALSDDAQKLTLSEETIVGPFPNVPMYGYGFSPFEIAKVIPVPPVTVADFVGTYQGGLSESMSMAGTTYPAQNAGGELRDFVFEEFSDGTNNVVMKAYFGVACNVPGVFDPETRTATFSEGSVTGIQATGNLTAPLVLLLSEDYTTLTQQSSYAIQPSGMPFTLESTLTVLTKQQTSGGDSSFSLSLVTLNQWDITYSVSGESKAETSGNPTTFQAQSEAATTATGCNLYIPYFICGYNTGYANFDESNGTLTLPLRTGINDGVLYFPAIDWKSRKFTSDVVLQMSADHNTIVATGDITLDDGTVLSNFTLTKK